MTPSTRTLLLLAPLLTFVPSCDLATCPPEEVDTGDDCLSEDDVQASKSGASSATGGNKAGGTSSGGTSSGGGGGAASSYDSDDLHAVTSPLREGFSSSTSLSLAMQLLQAGIDTQDPLRASPKIVGPALTFTGDCPGASPQAGTGCQQGPWVVNYRFERGPGELIVYTLEAITETHSVNVSGVRREGGQEDFNVEVHYDLASPYFLRVIANCQNQLTGMVEVQVLTFAEMSRGGFSVGCYVS